MMKKLLIATVLVFVLIAQIRADRVEDMPVTVVQPNGTELDLFVTGDEFYHYYHDRYGFTILQDDKGVFRYVYEFEGKLLFSPYVVGEVDPLKTDLKPFATISKDEYLRLKEEFLGYDETTYKSLTMVDDIEAFQTGDFNNVVILIRFTDSPEFVGEGTVQSLFNGSGNRSVKEYYSKVSYGKLNMVSHFLPRSSTGEVITYNAPNDYSYYNESNARKRELFAAAVAYANSNATGFSANIDKDNNGRVDNVSFVLNHRRNTAWGTPLWPHKSYYGGASLFGKTVGTYYLAYTADSYRTHVHEMFHVLSAPDLYHYTGNGISPAGSWDLMQSSGGHMMSYMKKRYGKWVDDIQQIDNSGVYYMKSVGKSDSQNAYYIQPDKNKDELFYMEYRNKSDDIFEATIPGSGIIFYRINPRLHGNAQGPPDMLYVFRPNGSELVNGNVNQAYFSAQSGRTVFDPGTNPNPFYSDNSVAEFRVHSVGSSGEDSIGFTLDFDHIENFRITNSGEDFINMAWDKEDSVLMVCSRNPIKGAPQKGVAYNTGDVISDGSQVIYVGSGNVLEHTGLKTGSYYYYKIWIIDTKYGSYIGSANASGFTTFKEVFEDYPFYTSFEQDVDGQIPQYWGQYSNVTEGLWKVDAEKSTNGSKGMKYGMYYNNSLLQKTFETNLRPMAFRMKAGRKYHISYNFKPLYNESSFVNVSKKADGTGLSTIYTAGFEGLPWQSNKLEFIPDEDTIYYIYFGMKAYQGYGGFIDEVSVVSESPVPMPDMLKSQFTNDSTVKILWNETGSALMWEVKYGPKGFDPEIGGKHIKNLSVRAFTIENLEAAKAYDWYVRSVMPDNESYWAGAAHFTTKHPQTESINYMYETFEDVEVPGLPSFWKQVVFKGTHLWGSEVVGDEIISKLSVFNETAEAWMITKPLNIEGINNPHISFIQNNFGYEREQQEVMVSTDYDGVGDPSEFTWKELSDSVYEYGSYNVRPMDLTPYKDARTLFIAWRMSTVKGGINFWEVDNVSLSDLYNVTFNIKDLRTNIGVAGATIKDEYGNTIATSDESGNVVVPFTYQYLNLKVCHEHYEDFTVSDMLISKDEVVNVSLTPKVKVTVIVKDKAKGTLLPGVNVLNNNLELMTDSNGEVEFYVNESMAFVGEVSADGYNTAHVNTPVDGNAQIIVELTKPQVSLPESDFSVSLTWGDTVLCVAIENKGDGPVDWQLRNDFSASPKLYNGLKDEEYIFMVASSKAHPELVYLMVSPYEKPDSILAWYPFPEAYRSIEFDNHGRLYGISEFGRQIVSLNNSGVVDELINGIELGLRFDELVINRINGDMYALGGDPYNLKDKHIYKIVGDSVELISDLEDRDLGLFATGDMQYIMGSVAIQGTWKIESDGNVAGRFPRRYNLADLKTGFSPKYNGALIYSTQVGANSQIYKNTIGLIAPTTGNYTLVGNAPDSVNITAISGSSRVNDWFAPLASHGTIEAGATDTLKITIMNDIPEKNDMFVKGIISTWPNVGDFEFNVNASLRGYTAIQHFKPAGFEVYPNPSKGQFLVKGLNGYLTVYNVTGKSILKTRIKGEGVLSLDSAPNGMYLVKDTESGFVFKVVKE